MRRLMESLREECERLKSLAARTSVCRRYGVGVSLCSVNVDGETLNHIASFVNGSAWCNAQPGACGCMHAEAKLAMWIAHDSTPLPAVVGLERIVVTQLSPCAPCANLLAALWSRKRISAVVFTDSYSTDVAKTGERILTSAGVRILRP